MKQVPSHAVSLGAWGAPILPGVAELDLIAKVPGFEAELDLAIGRAMKTAMATPDRMQLWRSLGSPVPKRVDVAGTVTAAQAGLATPTAYFAWAAKPQSGRIWSVRKIVLQAGSPPITNVPFSASAISNLTAAVFVGQGGMVAAGAGFNPSPQDVDQTSVTLPTTQFYSTHQLWVRGGEWLVVGIQGPAVVTGFQVWGHARVVEIDDSPEFLMTL